MKDLSKIEERIGVIFKDRNLLLTAFVHRSFLNENKSFKKHNERLEFLGDAVLELVVTEHLYNNFMNPEGDLTNWRSALVKTDSISEAAKRLGYEDYLLMSRGEATSSGRARQLILANCFEAVTGAIYLDQGYQVAKKFLEKNLLSNLPKIIEEKLYIDPKSHFQEIAQEKEGPDHDKKFTVAVKIGDQEWGKGNGASKQLAQQAAAQDALLKYQKE
jgi:ribonuclease-3